VFSLLMGVAGRIGSWAPAPVWRAAERLWDVCATVGLMISPAIPVDLRNLTREPKGQLRLVVCAFGFGVVFSLVGPALFSWLEGTFAGTDPSRLYFIEDRWNLALYTVITPTYIALDTWMIVITIRHWASLRAFADNLSAPGSDMRPRHLGIGLAIAVSMTALLMSTYMNDILSRSNVEQVYWFMEEVGGGRRALNQAGYYYLVLNATLMFLTILTVGSFFTLAVEVLRVGRVLDRGGVTDFAMLREQLETFTKAYLIAKALAATYMVNAFIWKDSPLGATTNLAVAGFILTAVGVFFLAVPRLFVELRWFQFALQAKQAGDVDEDLYRDIRPGRVRLLAHALDVVLIGGFVSAFYEIELNPVRLLGLFNG
jgi:hypothetical protein